MMKTAVLGQAHEANADQSAMRTMAYTRNAHQRYNRFMRFLGYGFICAAFVVLLAANADGAVDMEQNADPAKSQVERLFEAHDCWSGEAPADMKGTVPTHAVADLGNGPAYVNSKVGFDIWLEGRTGTLYGFCK